MKDGQPKLRTLLLTALLLLGGCDRFTSAETRVTRATASLEAGKYQAALIELRKLLDSHPDDLTAQLLLVDVLSASGETVPARQQLDQAIKAGAPPSATDGRSLRLLLALGDLEGVRKALEGSTTLSAAERAMFEGQLLLAERKPAEAQAAFERALAVDPGMEDALIGRIETMVARGAPTEALQSTQALLARKPDNGRALMIKGMLATQSGDFRTATEAYSAAIERGKGLTRSEIIAAHTHRMEGQLAAGQLDAARSSLPALDAVAGNAPVASLMRAKVALAAKDTSTAVNELRGFTQAAPQYLPARMLLVSALFEQGSTEQAFAEAARNVSEFSDSDEPRLALAQIELRLGRSGEAEETLQPLITRSPPNPLATAMLAQLKMRRGESVAGVSLLEQSLAEQPGNQRLQLMLAAAYLSGGEPKRTLATLDRIDDKSLSAARDRLHVIATSALQGPAAAERELESAIKRYPDDVDLLMMAAAYRASTDRVDQARGYLAKARELRPEDPTLALTLAQLELMAGRGDEAAMIAQKILEKTPDDATAMTLMAGIAAQRGQESEADAWLNRARIAKPQALSVRMAIARRAAARGDTAEARTVLLEAARNSPLDAAPRIALAELDSAAGRHADALEALREAGRQTQSSSAILLAMAKVQLAAGDTAAARKSLRQALDAAPGWTAAAATLAALETNAGNLNAALEVVREVRRADPESAASFALEGDVYRAAKRPADAAAAFIAAYQRTPGATLAIRAAQEKATAKVPAPEAELLDWLKRAPNDATARRALGEYLLAAGKNTAAIAEFEKVVAARPADAAALNNLAWLYQQSNDPRARSTAEKAFAAAPRNAAVADTYGWILVRGREIESGLAVLEQAAQLAPQDAEIQFHLAHALSTAGQRQRAAGILRNLLDAPKRFESRDEATRMLKTLEQ